MWLWQFHVIFHKKARWYEYDFRTIAEYNHSAHFILTPTVTIKAMTWQKHEKCNCFSTLEEQYTSVCNTAETLYRENVHWVTRLCVYHNTHCRCNAWCKCVSITFFLMICHIHLSVALCRLYENLSHTSFWHQDTYRFIYICSKSVLQDIPSNQYLSSTYNSSTAFWWQHESKESAFDKSYFYHFSAKLIVLNFLLVVNSCGRHRWLARLY